VGRTVSHPITSNDLVSALNANPQNVANSINGLENENGRLVEAARNMGRVDYQAVQTALSMLVTQLGSVGNFENSTFDEVEQKLESLSTDQDSGRVFALLS
jgi:hypothetical protein